MMSSMQGMMLNRMVLRIETIEATPRSEEDDVIECAANVGEGRLRVRTLDTQYFARFAVQVEP